METPQHQQPAITMENVQLKENVIAMKTSKGRYVMKKKKVKELQCSYI